ncbi:hypothetical protein H4582DRAFT_1958952 [Lactarius indigo]|nr:hypothetical protein H4582DRAFT_1958952 [Lactarius indigo]
MGPVTSERMTRRTRSGCSRAARILSSSSGAILSYSMTIGKAGQQPRPFLTGVPWVQRSSRLRRNGDANMRYRHLWQTCTSCHSKSMYSRKPPRLRPVLHKSNISSRTLSGNVDTPCLWSPVDDSPISVGLCLLISPISRSLRGPCIESAPEVEWRGMLSVDMKRLGENGLSVW